MRNSFIVMISRGPDITTLLPTPYTYSTTCDTINLTESHLNCRELEVALSTYASTLISLDIKIDFLALGTIGNDDWEQQIGDGDKQRGLRRTLNLKHYTALKHVKVDPELLLGFSETPSPELSDCLPECLESLHFPSEGDQWWAHSSPWKTTALPQKLERYIVQHGSLKVIKYEHFYAASDESWKHLTPLRELCQEIGISLEESDRKS
ncbi:hypothetical protein BT63DRAFT_460624 [Microthyrium microscopicum]|uniref:Uncharacterized protein n=1 Tax=Microthyrium microscopicum TaxID=703497 RepID=A0A6A6TWY3_9PEZI|nr:hypothetical protein BT63DRAFT_460624 [Microthyrium microscopicum]